MNRYLSQKFRFFTLASIALLVYVHGYNLEVTYLSPFSTIDEPLNITTFTEFFLANGLLRFRIPLLFMISGYLYAFYDNKPYKQQIKYRAKTLLVPYFLWSAIGILFTFLLQQYSYTAKLVYETKIDQLGQDIPYTQIGFWGVINRWLFNPISYQLWFIIVLFFYNVFYPVISWAVKKIPWVWIAFSLLLFFSTNFGVVFLDGRGLLFFSLGVLFHQKNINIEKSPSWFNPGIATILFIGMMITKTLMAFELPSNSKLTYNIIHCIHQTAVIIGLFAMWFSLDNVIQYVINKKWFNYLSGYSFFIFGLHVPLLPYLMTWFLNTFYMIPGYRFWCYVFVPLLVLCICVVLGIIIKKQIPKVYGILTGGRGF